MNPTFEDTFLDSVEISGYRSCENTKFQLERNLSVLIGINGAGKTNVLQGIRLLGTRQQRRGRIFNDEIGQSPNAQIVAWFVVGARRVGLKLKYQILENARRGDEQISVDETWNLNSITGNRSWITLPPEDFFIPGPETMQKLGAFKRVSNAGFEIRGFRIPDWVKNLDVLQGNREVIQAIEAIRALRANISYYSASQFTDPTRCPSSFEVDEEGRLAESYSNLGNSHQRFLHGLYRLKKENSELYDDFCSFVSRGQLGLVSRISWKEIILSSNTAEVKSGGGIKKIRKTKTLVIPKVQVGSSHITFNQLSEGTFKTIALVFHMFTDSSRLLMVEEPEVCIHHGLLSKIVGTLTAQSSRKQILISTHSDQLLDQVMPENVFVVQMRKQGTEVASLKKWLSSDEKRALKEYLSESGTLGEYWKSGGLSK
jgi:AAA domain, putative AbiEii toxin, Type IV TA system/AAA ATPase domain